jgi:hypothetical protein
VRNSRSRRLTVLPALGLSLLQSSVSLPGLVVALALVASHDHAPTFLADQGHVDLVLTHAANGPSEDRHAAEQHLHSVVHAQDAHVLHLVSNDAAPDSMRRGSKMVAPIASFRPVVSEWPREIRALPRAREGPGSRQLLLQTVVLRI